MAYIGNFDASTIAPATEMTALPSGEYVMAITDSDLRDTKVGTGQYLLLVFTVLQAHSQEFVGRKVFVRLNIVNSNSTAVDIAQRELSAICHAAGVLAIKDSTQLHNIPIACSVKYVPAKGEFSESNKIVGYKPANAFSAASTAQRQPPKVPAAQPQPQPPKAPVTPTAQRPTKAPASSSTVPPWRSKPTPAAAIPEPELVAEADDVAF